MAGRGAQRPRLDALHGGWRDARITPAGPDAGVDVVAAGALAQVKAQVGKAQRSELQAFKGAAYNHDGELLFFAMGGYSGPALEYARAVEMSLFTYGFDGSVEAVNRRAQMLLAQAADPRLKLEPAWKPIAREWTRRERLVIRVLSLVLLPIAVLFTIIAIVDQLWSLLFVGAVLLALNLLGLAGSFRRPLVAAQNPSGDRGAPPQGA